MNGKIKLSKSCISKSEKDAVLKVLDNEYLGMGNEVQKFENTLTDFFGRPTVCVSTGTAALHLALQAVGVGIGDEVLVQSITYVSSFQAISATGATPVACDIDSESLCIDWKDAEKRLTRKTKAIMPVHYAGGVGRLNEIYEFANKHGLRVIEDAAHAFGTIYEGKEVGGFGDISCFSFDGIKNITSGEGGCIVTDNEIILQKIRNARLLGVENDTDKRFSGKRSWVFDVNSQGWRYHMSNIMASIGIAQFQKKELLFSKRRSAAKHYDEKLNNRSDIKRINHNYDLVVPHIYVLRIPSLKNREGLIKFMSDHGIEVGKHYYPNHLLNFYKANNPNLKLSISESLRPTLITLPLHPDLDKQEVDYITDMLLNNIKKYC